MQELRNNDTTDAAAPSRLSDANGTYFDPENDVDILQRQYKHKRLNDFISEEPLNINEIQHSQSDK